MQTLMLFPFKLPSDSFPEIKTMPKSVVDVTNLFVWEETEDDENAMVGNSNSRRASKWFVHA